MMKWLPHPCSDPDHHPAPPGPGGHRGGRRLLQLRLLRPRPGRRQPRLVPGGGGAGGRGRGTLVLSGVTGAEAGRYYCRVTTGLGTVQSRHTTTPDQCT